MPPERYAWSRASPPSGGTVARAPRRRTSVFVCSPHPLVRRGVAALLQDARHPVDVLAALPRSAAPVDVVVYDVIGLVTGNGADLDRYLRTGAAVLALSRSLRPQLAAHAVARGAVAAVSMTADAATFAAAVEEAAALAHSSPRRGGRREGARLDWDVASREVRETSGVALTARQVQVLDAVASGATNADIAAILHLSPNTVKTHVRTAYRVIGAGSRAEAVAWGLRHGLGRQDRPHDGR